MAEGRPLDDAVAAQAAEWLTLLMSEEVDEADRRRWRRWRQAHPDHDRAWRHIEAVTGRFQEMIPGAAYRALSSVDKERLASPGRRKVLGLLLMIGAGGTLGAYSGGWRRWGATYATRVGERRDWTLADGTRVTLNTGSALDVDFNSDQRCLRLLAGEVWVVTAHVGGVEDPRPLVVETAQGQVRSLGTRFSVRQEQDRTRLMVSESAVAVRPGGQVAPQVVRAGQTAVFSDEALDLVASATPGEPAWLRGQIVADDMPLGAFLDELERYRPGLLHHDASVAGLRVSGVFPLDDTDRILETLPRVIPVHVHWRTRYWVTVTSAP